MIRRGWGPSRWRFDADLSLRIPKDATVGAYRSTLTLTLIGL